MVLSERDPNDKAKRAQEAMEKYMAPVPAHLTDLISHLNGDLSKLPEWERDMIVDLKAQVQQRIREHFEAAAMTRQKFVSMPVELWQEEDTGLFRLTESPRKILGYLPKHELRHLNEIVRGPLTRLIEEKRMKLDDIMDKMRASDSDRAEIEEVQGRDTFFFKDLEDHEDVVNKWIPIFNQKMEVIAELEQREEFLEEIEEFEKKATGDKDRYKKSNSLALADENKFRAYAAKKLKELDAKAIKLCKQYEEDVGRRFEIDGIFYLEMIKEQKYGRSQNPSLYLAKLRPEAIPAAAKLAYAGLPASNLTAVSAESMGRVSKHEAGEDTRVIRGAAKAE